MIKRLGHHLKARAEQQRYLWAHLKAQYADRLVYYKARSFSRQKDLKIITIIQDGMDQGKVSLPRSPLMKGKDLSMMQKPKLHVSLTIVHGYFMIWCLSNPDCQKDSNASVEPLAHAMTLLNREYGLNLGEYRLIVHADNTCREVKNNHVLRWAAAQVSCKNLESASFRFLRTGHSHEDVDQCFGRLARHLSRVQKVQTPSELLGHIAECANAMHRPHEEKRFAIKMDETRDWTFGSSR